MQHTSTQANYRFNWSLKVVKTEAMISDVGLKKSMNTLTAYFLKERRSFQFSRLSHLIFAVFLCIIISLGIPHIKYTGAQQLLVEVTSLRYSCIH